MLKSGNEDTVLSFSTMCNSEWKKLIKVCSSRAALLFLKNFKDQVHASDLQFKKLLLRWQFLAAIFFARYNWCGGDVIHSSLK